MAELKPIIEESFAQYAGAVLQSRALVDVRDCLKPSARQIFYCLYTDKFIHSKPFKKTLKGIGSAMRMYIHGDSSCEGVIMRAGQPFAMRYPLIEVEGSYGNLMESGNWAAPRYTASRLSSISNYLFEDINKNTINEWRDNYDDTEKYPSVLPTKGFYNIVNGSMGIGIGMSSSIPQFNIKEVNNALIKLLWNKDCDFEDIYCAPDFATGAILLNEEEVKESLKNGVGKACKLRSVVEFDSNERCLVVTEIPYSVYTNTICKELEEILNSENNPGIDRFNDLTGSSPLIKIYLSKNGNPDRVLKYLYKNTSLQYYYGINMTMLDDGRFPKVFSWKEALQSYINHEMQVYNQAFLFDLNKIKSRLHIISGLLKAINTIDEVIKIIKSSTDSRDATLGLQKFLNIDELQAKAILDIKLSRLAHLEIEKLENEKNNLLLEKNKIENILSDEVLFKKEIEKGFKNISDKFGDERRTKIFNIENENSEPVEVKSLVINLTNKNNLFVYENSSLYVQKRKGIGSKFKLESDEYIISSINADSSDMILFFSQKGNFYHYKADEIQIENKVSIEELFQVNKNENICAITSFNQNKLSQDIIFITKDGIIKKSSLSEYNVKRSGGIIALKLKEEDFIIETLFSNGENISILTKDGKFLIINPNEINRVGRVAVGVKAIKLNKNDFVVGAKNIYTDSKYIVSISKNGLIKKTDINEFEVSNRGTKGIQLQKVEDELVGFEIFKESNKNIGIASSQSILKFKINEIPCTSRGAKGSKAINLKDTNFVIGIVKGE